MLVITPSALLDLRQAGPWARADEWRNTLVYRAPSSDKSDHATLVQYASVSERHSMFVMALADARVLYPILISQSLI
jgi:hypothetical protein